MDQQLINHAVSGLRDIYIQCSALLSRLEELDVKDREKGLTEWENYELHETRDHFSYKLDNLYFSTYVVLDGLKLDNTMSLFTMNWNNFRNNGISNCTFYGDIDALVCPSLEFASNIINSISLFSKNKELEADQRTYDKFIEIVNSLPHLIYKRNADPSNEHQVHEILRDYLSVCFKDFVHKPKISGITKSFEPDGGILSIKTAFELKYIGSEKEVRTAISGVFEDNSGYKGTKDWENFVSIFYMTEAFESPARILADLTRAECNNWEAVVVVGKGERAQTKKKQKQTK